MLHSPDECLGRSMNIAEAIVFVVDDDASVRRAMQRLLHSVGLPSKRSPRRGSFYDVSRLLARRALSLTCRCPKLNGLTLQELLAGGRTPDANHLPYRLRDCP